MSPCCVVLVSSSSLVVLVSSSSLAAVVSSSSWVVLCDSLSLLEPDESGVPSLVPLSSALKDAVGNTRSKPSSSFSGTAELITLCKY